MLLVGLFLFYDNFMNSLQNIVRALQKERRTIQRRIKLVEYGLKALGSLDGSSMRRRMSAAARRKIARAQKLRWARYRAKA